MTHAGTLRCLMKSWGPEEGGGHTADMLSGCTWMVRPYGLVFPTPDVSAPECILDFCTDGDRLAELEAHVGILYIFEYGEMNG